MTEETELAWAAGFFDGEGNVSKSNGGGSYRLGVTQKDPLLLHRFALAVGRGKVCTQGKGRIVFQLYITKKSNIVYVLKLLWPYLGSIKKNQARKVIEHLDILVK